MDIRTDRMKLSEVFPDVAKTWAKKLHVKADSIEYVRKGIPIDPADISIEEGERAVIRLISTPHVDRDKEILVPSGAMLDDFRQNPVCLYAHDYSGLPVGKDLWIKPTPKGILVKTVYANHQFADDVYGCVKGRFLNTSSAGFIPVEVVENGEKGFDAWQGVLEKDYGISKEESGGAARMYTKWALLEHSDVPVPANQTCLNLLVGKGISARLKKDMGVPDAEPAPLLASGDIVIANGKATPAGEVKVGDMLMNEDGQSVPVIGVTHGTKTADADGTPSVDDIRCALHMALNPPPEPQSAPDDPAAVEMNSEPTPCRYVCDLFPVDFPSGHFTYGESCAGELTCDFYQQDYTYADDEAMLVGEPVEVIVAWAEKGVAVIPAPELGLAIALSDDMDALKKSIDTLKASLPVPDITEPPALRADIMDAVKEIKAAIATLKAPVITIEPIVTPPIEAVKAAIVPVPEPSEDITAAVVAAVKALDIRSIVAKSTRDELARLKGRVE